ncbi:MAG: glycine oxidase ThiO [Mycobacteriaceae bacterium]
MSDHVPDKTVHVIGGGIIGLSVAWKAALAGWQVQLFDPRPGQGASWVAGGMLAPSSEAWFGEAALFELGQESLSTWPQFASELTSSTKFPVVASSCCIQVAYDSGDISELKGVTAWLAERGRIVQRLSRQQIHETEPLLSQSIRYGATDVAECSVDNRATVDALIRACSQLGVKFVHRVITDLDEIRHGQIVIAAGLGARQLIPWLPIHPVKGEILRLTRRKASVKEARATVRARVHGRQVYIVPRIDGVVVGATSSEQGGDTTVTVQGVQDLLQDACLVMPALADYELSETAAGLRPSTPDALPMIGRIDDRITVATGHGRSGFLLAPLTADLVLSDLERVNNVQRESISPRRFR